VSLVAVRDDFPAPIICVNLGEGDALDVVHPEEVLRLSDDWRRQVRARVLRRVIAQE
jgi:hypothetical protein